jgi:hypothetical protein
MRSLIIILFIVHFSSILCGQNALKLIDTTSQWNMSQSIIVIENDTVVNQRNYNKLICYSDSNYNKIRDTYFIREDSTGKVFLANTKEEIVAFDFNLAVGDTFILNILGDEPDHFKLFFRVDSITTIILSDNKEYQAQHVTVCSYFKNEPVNCDISTTDIWVKGVGSLKFGIVYPKLFGTGGREPFLLCYFSNQKLVYQNPECINCFSYVSVPSFKTQKRLINLIPTSEGRLQLQLLNKGKGELNLYTLEGLKLLNCKITKNETELCVPSHKILVYRFETLIGEVQTGKVLVK